MLSKCWWTKACISWEGMQPWQQGKKITESTEKESKWTGNRGKFHSNSELWLFRHVEQPLKELICPATISCSVDSQPIDGECITGSWQECNNGCRLGVFHSRSPEVLDTHLVYFALWKVDFSFTSCWKWRGMQPLCGRAQANTWPVIFALTSNWPGMASATAIANS